MAINPGTASRTRSSSSTAFSWEGVVISVILRRRGDGRPHYRAR
ncbi:hypothetical protein ACIP5N_32825 [Streptomyces sp. NPDC088768]